MFPPLPSLGGFLPSGSGSGSGGIGTGGINIGWNPPPIVIGGDNTTVGGSTVPVTQTAGVKDTISAITSFVSCLMSPGTCLLRLVILIIGLICIIGAIYLYKPTQEIVAAPARAIKGAAKAAGEGLAAGAA